MKQNLVKMIDFVLFALPFVVNKLSTMCLIVRISHYIVEIVIHISHLIRNRYK